MKIVKVVISLLLVLWWITSMNDEIKGEGVIGSFIGIVVLIGFIYGAYKLFFNNE